MSKSANANDVSKIEVLDGKLHIFRRKDTKYWWCGYHHSGVYKRISTKKTDLTEATEAAKKWYYGEQYQLANGHQIVRTKVTFAYYARLALTDYERLAEGPTHSKKYVNGLKKIIENHLIPFFGNHKITSVDQSLWHKYVESVLVPRNLKTKTIKQHLNGIRVVYRRAKLRGDAISTPEFHTERTAAAEATPRTWLNQQERMKLITELHQNIKDKKGTRWEQAAYELLDYVEFMLNVGLRVDEAKNLRFIDIRKKTEHDQDGVLRETLFIDNIIGKRGRGSCKTLFGAVIPFNRIINRRNLNNSWQTSSERVFLEHHRDMFNTVLKSCKLKFTDSNPPLRRDLMSLRNTFICERILEKMPIGEIAMTCRTSVAMIENNYARWLSASDLNINRSNPPTAQQQNKANEDAQRAHIEAVMPMWRSMLQEVEKEMTTDGDDKGAQPSR